MNLPAAPERGPLTVLLYDVLNTPLDAKSSARAQVLDFLKNNSGRRIAVIVLGDRQLDIPQSAGDRYQSDLSFAALAFGEDGETLWGTTTQMKDTIPASKLGGIRKNGFQAVQAITIPATTTVIRLVVRDEHSGRIGSMEIRLPLPPDAGARGRPLKVETSRDC